MSGKGGEFERDVAKFLTKWLTGKKKPLAFWRMPGSGSFATISEENSDMSGDIRGITSEGMEITNVISIECKTGYPKTSFWQLFKEIKNFNIKLFWKQCCNDAKKPGKYPVLIYRKLRQEVIIGINKVLDNKLIEKKPKLDKLPSMEICWNDLESIKFYSMKKFFNVIKPEDIKDIK